VWFFQLCRPGHVNSPPLMQLQMSCAQILRRLLVPPGPGAHLLPAQGCLARQVLRRSARPRARQTGLGTHFFPRILLPRSASRHSSHLRKLNNEVSLLFLDLLFPEAGEDAQWRREERNRAMGKSRTRAFQSTVQVLASILFSTPSHFQFTFC
jgi:hypothetical protein